MHISSLDVELVEDEIALGPLKKTRVRGSPKRRKDRLTRHHVVGYVRLGSFEQEVGYPSLDKQRELVTDYALKHSLCLEGIYDDAPITPAGPISCSLGGILSLLDDVFRDKKIRYVIITAPDRLQREELKREEQHTVDIEWELIRRRREILVVGRDMPEIIPEQNARSSLKGRTGSNESSLPIGEKLLRGRVKAAAEGRHQSGPAPYGYERDYSERREKGVLIVPHEIESKIVVQIFDEYMRLRSLKKLQDRLEDLGIRTRREKRWSRAGLAWILRNETYIGFVNFSKVRSQGIHQPLVDKFTFEATQGILSRRSNKN
jgi:hypothetical protein